MRFKTLFFFLMSASNIFAVQISLGEAVKSALLKNPNLQVSAFSQRLSEADSLKENAPFDFILNSSFLHTNSKAAMLASFQTDMSSASLSKYTTLGSNFSLNYSKSSNIYTLGLSPTASTSPYSASAGISFSQNLLKNFGSKVNTTKIYVASKTTESAKYSFLKETLDMAYDAQIAYWNLYEAQKGHELDGYGLSIVDELLRRKLRMVELGGFPRALIQEIISSKSDMQTALANSDRNLKLAQISFAAIMGAQSDDFEAAEPPFEYEVNTGDSLKNAHNSRPEMLINKAQKESLERLDGYYANQLLPTLTMSANFGSNNPSAQTQSWYPYSQNHNLYSAGINFSMPIENSSANADIQKNRLNLMLVKAQENKIKQDISYQVKKATVELERVGVVLKMAKQSVAAQEEVMKNEDRKLELGLTTMKNYLDNQNLLVSRKKSVLAYECLMMRTIADYHKAIGRLPEYLNITLGLQK